MGFGQGARHRLSMARDRGARTLLATIEGVRNLPSHLIRESEWPVWLAGSVVKAPAFHSTRAGLTARIMGEGLRIEASEFGACQGIYLAARPWTVISASATTLRVAVCVHHPMRVRELADLPEAVGLPRHTSAPQEIRNRLVERGHDAVLTNVGRFGGPRPNQFIVALHNGQVRIIVPDEWRATSAQDRHNVDSSRLRGQRPND